MDSSAGQCVSTTRGGGTKSGNLDDSKLKAASLPNEFLFSYMNNKHDAPAHNVHFPLLNK